MVVVVGDGIKYEIQWSDDWPGSETPSSESLTKVFGSLQIIPRKTKTRFFGVVKAELEMLMDACESAIAAPRATHFKIILIIFYVR